MPERSDSPAIAAYYRENDEHCAPWSPLRAPSFYSEPYWALQIEHLAAEFLADKSLKLILFDKSSGEPAGHAHFSSILRGPAHYCTLGYALAHKKQGQGYMFEALKSAIPYVFDTLNLHRIAANYIPHNERSGKLLRRLGFTPEGYARDYLFIAGRWQDHILTSLVNEHWQEPRV
jgi:ribosomal-protein-alanine N-acetyltransferase